MITRQPRFVRRSRQQGMALLIALIVLVVVSILGTVAMRTALFQSRVSVNSQVENLAFQSAESGLDAAVGLARLQVNGAGPDAIPGNANDAEIIPADTRHIFNRALNVEPQIVCVTSAGAVWKTRLTGIGGSYDENEAPSFDPADACDPLPDSNTQVTTVIGQAPPDSYSAAVEAFDLKYGGALIQVQVRAYGEVPNTNVKSVHAEDWGMLGPADAEGG